MYRIMSMSMSMSTCLYTSMSMSMCVHMYRSMRTRTCVSVYVGPSVYSMCAHTVYVRVRV